MSVEDRAMTEHLSTESHESISPAATMALAALAGAVVGYLFFTDQGRQLRERLEPMVRAWTDEMGQLQQAAEKVRAAYQESRNSLAAMSRVTHAPLD
jgi:hypothetical protein